MTDETGDDGGFVRPVIHNMNEEEVQARHEAAGADPLEIMAMRLFVQGYENRFRFNHTRGKWMEWTGERWKMDETGMARHEMIELVERMRQADPQNRRALGKLSFSGAALGGAQFQPQLAVIQEQFDGDPYLLGTPTGYVDLRTGKHHKPDRTKMISKSTAVAPDRRKTPKRWIKFIKWACGGDEELVAYIQKFLGYCLSGLMKEEIMTFVYGSGGNGKGVMLSVIAHILGDYYVNTPASTFMATNKNEHATELARLNGARLVSASETGEDDKWNIPRIKEITGNENPISARFMRQDFFEFWPTCKLLIIGNNKPQIGDVDPAIARRLRLIEFTQRPTVADADLKEKMEDEYDGILGWMVKGFQMYLEEGLNPPANVLKASTAYLTSQDIVAQFLDEWTEVKPEGILLKKDITLAIQLFTKQNGITSKIPATRVYKKLIEHRGYEDGQTYRKDRCFKGLRLNDHAWGIIAKQLGISIEADMFRGISQEHQKRNEWANKRVQDD